MDHSRNNVRKILQGPFYYDMLHIEKFQAPPLLVREKV